MELENLERIVEKCENEADMIYCSAKEGSFLGAEAWWTRLIDLYENAVIYLPRDTVEHVIQTLDEETRTGGILKRAPMYD